MKKLFKFILILPLLCGCANHRTNCFVEGNFVGNNEYDLGKKYYFVVLEITKEEFNSCNSVNVVNDTVTNKYFKLSFFWFDSDGEKYSYSFKNLKEEFGGSKATRALYRDDNNFYVRPFAILGQENLDEAYYSVEHYDNDDMNYYCTFYKGAV